MEAMMNPNYLLGLLLALAASAIADTPFYVPQITSKPYPGRLTDATFTLEEPQCIFQQYSQSNVWLVVAMNSVVPSLTDTNLRNPVPYSFLQKNTYYHIYPRTAADYPCFDMAPQLNALMLVGSDTNCTSVSYCNGPLNKTVSYRVKFVVLNNSNTLIASTRWSEIITLNAGQNRSILESGPVRRSAGMIVIVVILSVLLALLLASLITAIVFGSKDVCWCRTIHNDPFLAKDGSEDSDSHVDVVNLLYIPHRFYKTHSRPVTERPATVYTIFK